MAVNLKYHFFARTRFGDVEQFCPKKIEIRDAFRRLKPLVHEGCPCVSTGAHAPFYMHTYDIHTLG